MLAKLPFLFADRTPPAAPVGLAPVPAQGPVTLAWTNGKEPDLAGYAVYRSATPGGPYVRVNTMLLLARAAFIDRSAPGAVPSYYVVRAVDSSGNTSPPSAEALAQPS